MLKWIQECYGSRTRTVILKAAVSEQELELYSYFKGNGFKTGPRTVITMCVAYLEQHYAYSS